MPLPGRQIRSMSLAGTVAVPQTFPEIGRLSIEPKPPEPRPGEVNAGRDLLIVEHEISPKLVIVRTFFLSDVAAVFLPHDSKRVSLDDGTWLVGRDVAAVWHAVKNNSPAGRLGIAYVREQAATLMQVEVGMTAAESVEYYPPLPNDRTVDHYRFSPLSDPNAGQGTLCGTAQDPGYCTDRGHGRFTRAVAAPRRHDDEHIACT